MRTVTERIILEMRIVTSCLLVGLIAMGCLYLRSQHGAPPPKPLTKADPSSDSLKFQLALSNETDFEHAHNIRARLDDCRPSTGSSVSCSAFTDEGAPVAYHCDYDGCAIDCGAVK